MYKQSGHIRFLIAIVASIFALLASSPVRAQQQPDEPPTEPILRLNTTAHSAAINMIATDRENRYAVTASHDKTARVWSLTDNRLLAVLRVPIGEGHMGKLYAVAMTPDGATVALGGWSGLTGKEKNIYLFGRASGALQQRISGLPDVVQHLAYSKDGALLVAGLGASGIRVYDVNQGYRSLPSDTAYGDDAYWADFDGQSRLVTTSYDGFIRLYGAGRYDTPIAKVKGRGGDRPYSAVFSPSGERVAVGYSDSTAVDLLSGKDLGFAQAADTTGVSGPSLHETGWSADGRHLFAGGRVDGFRVRRWEDGGSGPHIDIEAANDTVMGLLPLKSGAILFAAQDPAFGIIDEQGRAKILQGPGQLVFRYRLGSLKVSKSGQTVEMGTNFPQHTVRFALVERRLDVGLATDETLTVPVTEAPDLKVTDWEDDYHPSFNGQPIALDSYELSRSLTVLPGHDGFMLGTEWAIRRFDPDGKLVCENPRPA
jgi:WD40 repeat protein